MADSLSGTIFPKNNALSLFASLIGTWATEGTHGMIPNTALHGQTTFEWYESGAFIRMRTTINEDVGIPDGVAIFGSDDKLGTYTMMYYDERGVSRNYQLSIEKNDITWRRDEPGLYQRNTLTLSEDGETMTGKGEISKDGSAWEQDLDLTYAKVATSTFN